MLSPQPGLLESLELGARKGHSEKERSGVKDLDQGPVPKFLLLSRDPLVDDRTSLNRLSTPGSWIMAAGKLGRVGRPQRGRGEGLLYSRVNSHTCP